jgi:DNA repair protein RadD
VTRLSEALDLRDYQLRAIDALRSNIRAGKRRQVLVMPTGGGKTVVAAAMIKSAAQKGMRSLFLAHRRELIDQTVDKLAMFGVQAGVIMASDPRRDDYLPVQVASVQTLARRAQRPHADLIIVDECHHATSESYRKVIDAYPNATIIGLTATPWRSDKIGLADIYETSVLAATPAELMRGGALVNYDAFAYDSPDLHKVRVTMGEFNQKDLALACNTSVLVGNVVREYLAHAPGRRAILFPVNIEHSKSLVAEFRSAGVSAEHVDCNTPAEIRADVMNRFRYGDVMMLSSVGVLTEGFDAPAAEVCILARPTQSLSLHLQMIGRVLRPSPSTGKTSALIHDHAGNCMRHGFPDDERDYSLTATPKSVIDRMTCPACHGIFAGLRRCGKRGKCAEACVAGFAGETKATHCPKCNEFINLPEEREASGDGKDREQVDGVRLSKEQIQKLRENGIRADLSDIQITRAAKATAEQKAAEYKRLLEVAQRKGFNKGFAAHAYRETFGKFPRISPDLLESVAPAERPFFPLAKRKAG